jgi:hypothetical protein
MRAQYVRLRRGRRIAESSGIVGSHRQRSRTPYARDHRPRTTSPSDRLPLKAYAAAHDLHVSSLYEAKSKLRRLGVLEESPPRVTPSRLVRVPPEAVRPSTPTMCRIHLRNGTVVEVAGAPEQLPGLIERVAALP